MSRSGLASRRRMDSASAASLSVISNAAVSTSWRVILPFWLVSALPVVRLMCSEVFAVPFPGDWRVIFVYVVCLRR